MSCGRLYSADERLLRLTRQPDLNAIQLLFASHTVNKQADVQALAQTALAQMIQGSEYS
jgi:hypothetical protein